MTNKTMKKKKPYTYTIYFFYGEIRYSGVEMTSVSRTFVDGYLVRYLRDYPSNPIEIIRSDGVCYFAHPGNGVPHTNKGPKTKND